MSDYDDSPTTTPYPTEIYAAGQSITSVWNAIPGRTPTRCHANQHYFECRHELACECGDVIRKARVSEVVGEGL